VRAAFGFFAVLIGCTAAGLAHGQAPDSAAPAADARVRVLQGQLAAIDQKLATATAKLPGLKSQVQDLVAKINSVQAPAAAKAEPKEDVKEENLQPQRVEYRPPLYKKTDKKPSVIFVCREGRVLAVDLAALDAALDTASAAAKAANKDARSYLRTGAFFSLRAGDFDVSVVEVLERIRGNKIQLLPRYEAVPKSGRAGESREEIEGTGSAFRAYLTKLNPGNVYLQFTVYPDSFDVFRQARSAAWARGFDLIWRPIEVGGKVKIGGGSGGTL
jgi:hypothetical protein